MWHHFPLTLPLSGLDSCGVGLLTIIDRVQTLIATQKIQEGKEVGVACI